MIKNIFITGATSGIGAACAELYASHGHQLFLTGRRADKLEALKQRLEETYRVRVTVYCFDVRDKPSADAVAAQLKENQTQIHVLVNNAGLALGRHSFDDADMNDWEVMIDTNIKGVLYVTRALLPLMQPGAAHIVNIGSVAGKEVYDKGNVYCATKFALDALSQSMRIDLLNKSIKVTAIHPGAVQTEFSLVRFKGDQQTADAVYNGFTPLQAADVANAVYYCTSLPENVCINDLVITCTAQANAIYFYKQL